MTETPRFTLQEEPHGSGGFAKVIRGRDNVLERDIAIKVLDPLATEFSEADQERFRREARTLARLSQHFRPLPRPATDPARQPRSSDLRST